ncbi:MULTISPECIES: hypothetical protein [unclassified Microbacterium]|uniref:hypothetical protein n=1 Tax=unclassified Microbacterium TaxID=2609290 RepID=UPI002035AFD3|nr:MULTISPECIES: hypothetical protein [unclassified Microbacterium]
MLFVVCGVPTRVENSNVSGWVKRIFSSRAWIARSVNPGSATRRTERAVFGWSCRCVDSPLWLSRLDREDKVIDHAIVVLHPFEQRELETVRRAVEADSVGKLFVLIWSRYDMVRIWLDALGATNLHAGGSVAPADSLMLAAAEMIWNEDYNGLSSGRGKDAVVQLVRAFSAEGYLVEPAPWLRAYFTVGGSFRHAESIEKLVKEMKAGTRHRVKPRYRDNIVEIIREQVTAKR